MSSLFAKFTRLWDATRPRDLIKYDQYFRDQGHWIYLHFAVSLELKRAEAAETIFFIVYRDSGSD